MYARRQTRPKPRQAMPKKWSAPVAGWISNRALSDPASIDGPGAAVLDNFFPRATGVALRRGKELYATLEDVGLPTASLFTYRSGVTEQLFAANENTIYDISNVLFPADALLGTDESDDFVTEGGDTIGWFSTTGLDVSSGYTGGDWSVVQFATTGGIYLIGVNGVDTGFMYDGETFYPNVPGGVARLAYDAETTPFVEGETVTGGTSGATAVVWKIIEGDPGEGELLLIDVVGGPFTDGETLTGDEGGGADVNGAEEVAAPGMDFGTLTSADMSFVWAYKNRLYFVEKDTLNAWYLDVDSIGGDATLLPLGGVFSSGGALLFGARWSLESGGDGGLSDQNLFVTTQGEIAIYQGTSPDSAETWNLVGVYRVGTPLGKRAYMRGGGDIAIATTAGLVPLSKAISLDVTALNVATVSYKIADAWSDAIRLRGDTSWQALIWAEGKMAVIAPPDLIGASFPVVFVSNTETGSWARYTNWHALCMETFRGQLYFGSPGGQVFKANVGGMDDGETYSGAVVPLFEDMGAPASSKVSTLGVAMTRSNVAVNDRLDILANYRLELPPAPDATPFPVSNTWGTAIWGTSVWGSEEPAVIGRQWRSVGGIGYNLAPCYQVTSGSVTPIDVELIYIETLYTQTEMVG